MPFHTASLNAGKINSKKILNSDFWAVMCEITKHNTLY